MWAPLCTPGLRPRGRSRQQYGLAQCLRRGYLSASGLCNQQRSRYFKTLTSSRSDASSRRGRVTGPSYSSNSSETILSPGKAFLMPLYITLCYRRCVIVGRMDITCGRACHRRLQDRWLPPMSVPYFAPPCQPGSWWLLDIDSLEQRTEVKWWQRKMRKKWEMTNDKYLTLTTSFPPRIAIWIAASITFRMLTLGSRPRWSSRTSEYVPLFNHLFSLSEVLCIGSTAKVKDKSDNCDESYQEVPKSRGHRQVFCSPTEKLEHIGFFAHSDDICKLTKQCLRADLILSR